MICKAEPIEPIPRKRPGKPGPNGRFTHHASIANWLTFTNRSLRLPERGTPPQIEFTRDYREGGLSGTQKLLTAKELELLVAYARQGSRPAWEILASSFYGRVHKYLTHHLGDSFEAEDATQEVFLQAIRHLHQLRISRLFPAWIKAIARRTLRRYRHRTRGKESTVAYLLSGEKTEISSPTPDPPEVVEQEELAQQVRTAVATLGSLDRQTIEAHYFRGESLWQISRRLGCPLGTVKRRLHTARRRLAQRLEQLVSA